MNNLILWFLVAAISTNCLRNKVFIEHDYKYSLGFTDYKTYSFVECQRDTNIICEDVQQAIRQQMAARGNVLSYAKPDLFVNFFVYYDPIKYTGYLQPNMNYWLNNNGENDTYKPIKYSLKQGTLMVSLIEGSTSEIVWRGYATGIFSDNSHKKFISETLRPTSLRNIPSLLPMKLGKNQSWIKQYDFFRNGKSIWLLEDLRKQYNERLTYKTFNVLDLNSCSLVKFPEKVFPQI